MKRLSLVVPQEIEVVHSDLVETGASYVETNDSGLDIEVLRTGTELAASNSIHVTAISGLIGGRLARPRPFSVGPRDVVDPFVFSISLEETPGDQDWYGVTTPGVREYERVSYDDQTDSRSDGTKLTNGRLFSFNSDLWFLCESRSYVDTEVTFVVKIFKFNPDTSQFKLANIFPEPVNFTSYSSSTLPDAEGSPDWFVFNGLLHVGYRTVDASEGRNQVAIWQANAEVTSWKRISFFPIDGSFSTPFVSKMRLRFASSDNAIVCVYYAILLLDGRESHDMRSYVSYNGYDFETTSRNYKNAKLVDEGIVSPVRSVTNMAYFFVPEFNIYSDYRNFSVNFSLYYDAKLAAFVVAKGGDPQYSELLPNSLANNSYIVTIKTVDGNYLNWEGLSVHKLVSGNTGLMPNNGAIDHTDPDSNIDLPETFRVLVEDIDIVPGDVVNTMLISTAEVNPSNHVRYGTALVEFAYLHTEQVETIDTANLYSKGSKTHKEWAFVCSVIDPDRAGLVCGGSYSVKTNSKRAIDYTQICLGRWRGLLVSLPKINSKRDTLVYLNRWQNLLPERTHYSFAYSASMCSPDFLPYVSSEYTTYDSTNGRVVCDPAEYLYIQNTGPITVPSLVDKVDDNNPSSMQFKFRATIQLATSSTTIISECSLANGAGDGVRFRVIVSNTHVSIRVYNGVTYDDEVELAFSHDWTQKSEIVVGLDRLEVWVAARYCSSKRLESLGSVEISDSYGLGSNYLRVGSLAGSTLYLYDFQADAYRSGSKKIFDRQMTTELAWSETALANQPSMRSAYRSAFEPIELWDGTLLRFRGTISEFPRVIDSTNVLSRDLNSPKNLVDGLTDTLFDFTNIQPQFPTGEDHCHCYRANLSGVNDPSIGFQVVFKKERMSFNAFSLVNVYGVHCFELVMGNFEAGVWSDFESVPYQVIRKELDINYGPVKNLIRVTNSFDHGQLVGFNVQKYSVLDRTYVDSLKVMKNFDDIILLNKDLLNPGEIIGDFEFHLMMTAMSFQIPPELVDASFNYTHIGFKFYGISATDLTGVGEVVVGNLFQLVDYANSSQTVMSDTVQVNNGEFGYNFNSSNQYRPAIESWKIDLSAANGDNELQSVLSHISHKGQMFVIVEQQSDGANVSWPVHQGDIAFGSQDYEQSIQSEFDGQNYFARPVMRTVVAPPTVTLEFARVVYDETPFDIIATASDPAGGVLSYKWVGSYDSDLLGTDTFSYVMPLGSLSDTVRCEVTSSVSGLKGSALASIVKAAVPPVHRSEITVDETPVVTAGSATIDITFEFYMTPDYSTLMPDISPSSVWARVMYYQVDTFAILLDPFGSIGLTGDNIEPGYQDGFQVNLNTGSTTVSLDVISISEPTLIEIMCVDIFGFVSYHTVTLTP